MGLHAQPCQTCGVELLPKFREGCWQTFRVNTSSSRTRTNTGQVPASFRQRVLGLDLRSARTRAKLYALLDDAGPDALDGTGTLPRSTWLADQGQISQQQLTSAFSATQHRHLNPDGRSGVARLTWEAKLWSFEPHHDGWMQQQRILRLGPRLRAESYLAVCAQWALAHPRLATLGSRPRLPEVAHETLRGLASAGPQHTAENERVLLACGERIPDLVNDQKVDREIPPIINALRGDLATVQFSDDLQDEAYRLLAAIGRFTALAVQADTTQRIDQIVVAGMKSAIAKLNALSRNGEEGND